MNKRKKEVHIYSKYQLQVLILLMLSIFFVGMLGGVNVYAAEAAKSTDAPSDNKQQLEKAAPDNLNQTGYDVVYVVDNSKSVWKQQDYRNQALKNISNLAVGSDIRVGAVYFADHIYKTLALTSVESKEGSKKVLDFLNMKDQDKNNIDTNIGIALEAAVKLFDSQDSSRERIIVLFSDGINENLSGSRVYKEDADKKTSEQVKILKGMNVSVYCVYLEKKRNDEDYLKKIVNYFSDKTDYSGERFFKVKESNISDLSSAFVNVFYVMQNNMKRRQIEPDSTGAVNFYVPSLGITKLKIYLDGAIKEGTIIKAAGNSKYEKWSDGSSTFLNYVDPVPGEWNISIKSDAIETVNGTITYYANLQAAAELEKIDGEKKYQLLVHFYDEKGKEVFIDNMAKVSATMNFAGGDGNKKSNPIAMEISDGIAKSETFEMSEYGNYSYSVNLSYEDFINLDYTLLKTDIGKTAPVTTNIKSGSFHGEKTKTGIQFSIKEDELWNDLEGEEVKVINVVQLNAANPVNITQKDGYVVVDAKEASDVEFELQLEDASGMTSKVSVKGNIKNQATTRTLKKVFVIAAIIIVLMLFVLSSSKNNKKKSLEKLFEAFEKIYKEFLNEFKGCDAAIKKLNDNQEFMKDCIESKDGLLDMADELEDDIQKMYGMSEYIMEGYIEKEFEQAKKLLSKISKENDDINKLKKKVDIVSSHQKDIVAASKEMRQFCEAAKKCIKQLRESREELEAENDKMNERLEQLEETCINVDELLNDSIHTDLNVENISYVPGARGTMCSVTCKKGYYKLDDITLIGARNEAKGRKKKDIGTMVTRTGIYVFNFKDKENKQGLCLKSNRMFAIEDMKQGKVVKTKEANIFKGCNYKLIVKDINSGAERDMELTVG